MRTKPAFLTLALLGLAVAAPALAQETAAVAEVAGTAAPAVTPDVAYIFNTLLFLIGGFLVMWMAAGFAMLEAGLVRSKNTTTQLFKNISLFAIAGLMFWLVGYNLMYPGDDGWTIPGVIGQVFSVKTLDPVAGGVVGDGYSSASDFFFQLMFCATTASIVSGTLAERVKLWPFMMFTLVLTALIYPIEASWVWGGGWLSKMGFSDFAGSTLVHATGGFAALAGALTLGARLGRYKDGRVVPFPGSNLPLATLGTFILWLGWFGFNGASQLAMGTVNDAADVGRIFVNTNMSASAGVVAAILFTHFVYGKIDLTMVLNGALAGLVAITAGPLFPSIPVAILIGATGSVIACAVVPMLDKLKIDDVVGAIPVHLCAGVWGTLIVPLSNPETSYLTQLIGVLAIGGFTMIISFALWAILKATVGIRVSQEAEINGLDVSEMGMEAYPDFVRAK